MIQTSSKWAYLLLLPLGVLSLSMTFYRVSNSTFSFNVNHTIKISRLYIPNLFLQKHTNCHISQFSQLIIIKQYQEIIINFIFILGQFWYMFFCNYIGQKVIDHSSDIFHRMWVIYVWWRVNLISGNLSL